MRRLPLLAHGSVSRPLILSLLAALAVLVYGAVFVTSPTEQDRMICATWLQQYTERVDSAGVFEKAGYAYRDTTATSHGIYIIVDIRTDKPCKEIPRPVDAYFTHNKLGLLMVVRLFAEGEDSPSCSRWY